MPNRRQFAQQLALGVTGMAVGMQHLLECGAATPLDATVAGEDVFQYLRRARGGFDETRYKQILGAANEFKEGDQAIGVAADSDRSRTRARTLLANTRLAQITAKPPHQDKLLKFIEAEVDDSISRRVGDWTFAKLKRFLLEASEAEIKQVMPGLNSDVIGTLVKLMSNAELIVVGAKVFNPLPGSNIGAKGYLGARVQPNSPTDNVEDIRWQVFNAFSYAVGDVLVGTNPVASTPESVAAVEQTLQDVLVTFGIQNTLPHCVLSHIDVQHEVETRFPDSTALWFQSIAGTDEANATFDLSIDKMKRYAAMRSGQFGLYFETGQGADFTNGHGHGFDMVLHESRKYGFARALKSLVSEARMHAGRDAASWVHLNDVAGFIGPEVFRTREQLVRCCLEDIVMGKLHGLCIGLDVCSTLHMDVSLDDLDWCLDQIAPANPGYLMALPTKIDPMLGYLTTGYQDHVRLRTRYGYKVNEPMWQFFQQLGIISEANQPTARFGDPNWVYLQYRRRKGDRRADDEILSAGRQAMSEVRARGLFLAEGHGRQVEDLEPGLDAQIRRIYADGKESIWAELTPDFVASVPDRVSIATHSADRSDYILHPESGEQLSPAAAETVEQLRPSHGRLFDTQLVISDGLNAHSIMDKGHLLPFLKEVRGALSAGGFAVAPQNILITSGRVRAGYRVGELLFGKAQGRCSILHLIGERPGTGHHTFSVYITSTSADRWARRGQVDHNITKVVSGIATTALVPESGAIEVVKLLKTLI